MKFISYVLSKIKSLLRIGKDKKLKNLYVGDFETTTDAEDCRVWGWGLYDIVEDSTITGSTIDEFFEKYVFKLPHNSTVYFHNLKFDGFFIFYYLYRKGFTHSQERKLKTMEFTTLISDMNVFYSMTIMYRGKKIIILDSLKLIPFPVAVIAKAFKLEQKKGEIDYHKFRPVGHLPDSEEREYIVNDVEIVGKGLRFFLDQNLMEMTQASNAFYDFVSTIGKKQFDRWFPIIDCDYEIRQSYKGGFSYVNPKYQNQLIGAGIVLDVNSLYPAKMYDEYLPYGSPILYQGEYEQDDLYNLYVQSFRCNFELKEGYIPTLQLKGYKGFDSRTYLTSSEGLDVTLCLTSVDMELFFEHYEIYNIEYFHGWKFKSSNRIFRTYIDKWTAIKEQATIDGNGGLRQLAKLMLNALYGKFGLNPNVQGKIPTYDGEKVKLVPTEPETRDPIYIPVATFITSYARKQTITSAQDNYSRFIYADTDSLHLVGTEIPDNLLVDDVKRGYWAVESVFTKGKFLRAKSYLEEIDGKVHVTCAGLPKNCHAMVNFDNFQDGIKIPGKLQAKQVVGGIVLEEGYFTIKM